MEFVGIGSEGDSEIGSEGGEGDGVGKVDNCYQLSTERSEVRGVKCEHATEQSELSGRGDDVKTSVRSGRTGKDNWAEVRLKQGGRLTILALGLNLDQDLLLPHHLDNLPNVRSRFTKDK